MHNRLCVYCGSDSTYIRKDGYLQWHKYLDGYLCQKCFDKLIHNPRWNPITNTANSLKRILFNGKQIVLKENPRKGKCKECDKYIGDEYINHKGEIAIIKRTHMHHKKYDKHNALKFTKELCASCHGKLK